jgi:signal transduction histidine kinase/DNA-binding response OmpR family regulator/ligand-binding sensor domain-containing protein
MCHCFTFALSGTPMSVCVLNPAYCTASARREAAICNSGLDKLIVSLYFKKLIFMKCRLLIIAFTLSASVAYSGNVKFYSTNDIFGVSMRKTASVCKDANGFIWASSNTGVMRIAGNDCRIYSLPFQTMDIIDVRLICRNGFLLAYSNNGQLFRYNALSDRFDFVFHLGRMLKDRHLYVASVYIDRLKNVWLSTNSGLYRYSGEEFSLIDRDYLFNLTEYGENSFMFIKAGGVYCMDIQTATSHCLYRNSILSAVRVCSLCYDPTGSRLWIGTLSGDLFCCDLNGGILTQVSIRSFPKQPVRAITYHTDSTLLVGVDGQGVWEISDDGARVVNVYSEDVDDPFSLRGNGVYDIFCDDDKRVWVCTYSGGLSFFEQASPVVTRKVHLVNNANSLSNNNVNKVIEDSRGNIWFATDNGICCWNRRLDTWKTCCRNGQEQAHVFLSLCEDDRGQIWAGSYSSGVYVIDGKTGKETAHYSRDNPEYSFAASFIFDICKDSAGDLWLGGVMGDVIRYNSAENRFHAYPSLPVYAFCEFSPEQMLVACPFGLYSIDKRTGNTEILQGGYLLQDILFLDGSVWLCTCGDGLVRFDMQSRTAEQFTTESGLPSNYVNSIMWAEGYFWLGTETGLCRFNPEDRSVKICSSLHAMSSLSFNRSACCRLGDGQLMFGTGNGAVMFDPEALQQIQPQGRIFFQELSVSGRSVRDSSVVKLPVPLDSLPELTLKYNQNNLTLELLPLGNVASGAKFSWKLENHDREWTPPASHRILTYTNIPTGSYTLRIKMYDSALSQAVAERQLLVRVTPPFWETLWFRLLVFFMLIGIVYFSLRFYISRLKQRYTEDKVRFFTDTAHDIRTSLTLIKAPVEELTREQNLSEQGKYYLYLAIRQAEQLSSVATLLLDFQKVDAGKGQLSLSVVDIVEVIGSRLLMFESFAGSKNIELDCACTPSTYPTAIDETMIGKVIDNLVSNAIKYSNPDSRVEILFNGDERRWTLEVKDQGKGMSKKVQSKLFREFYRGDNAVNSKIIGSGIGLLLAKNYVELHGGTISCTSQENVGSTFKIVVPARAGEEPSLPRRTPDARKEPAVSRVTASQLPFDSDTVSMRILIVEDNDDLRNFMHRALSETFDVHSAEDGIQALEIIRKQQPDLIVSDVVMPNMDGFELCRVIKSTRETSHIPVILLTSLTEKAQQLHGLGLGADDYLTKPFDMTLLAQRIKSIVRNRKIVREKALKLIDKNRNEPILSNELNDRFVKKAVEVVHRHITDSEFGKDEFASAMNVSTSLLYKKIKSLTDQSPLDFIKSIRLNYGLELLRSHKYTVTEVSELCGFASAGYFSMVFKKHFGKSPTEIE